MSQHFLLSAAARSLCIGKVMRMSDQRRERFRAPTLANNRRQAGVSGLRLHDLLRLSPRGHPLAMKACGCDFSVTSGTLFAGVNCR